MTGRKRLERISESRRVDKTKSPRLLLFKESFMSETTPDVMHTPYRGEQHPYKEKTTGVK